MSVPAVTTASGRQYRLIGPELDVPYFPDVAHHLSQINRYSGACARPYSVAEHSLLCLDIARARGLPLHAQRAVFAHDWHEAYVNDAIGPVKAALHEIALANGSNGSDYDELEERHAQHLRSHFGLSEAFRQWGEEVKLCDRVALATERAALMPNDGLEWETLTGIEPWGGTDLMSVVRENSHWKNWRDRFWLASLELWADPGRLCE